MWRTATAAPIGRPSTADMSPADVVTLILVLLACVQT